MSASQMRQAKIFLATFDLQVFVHAKFSTYGENRFMKDMFFRYISGIIHNGAANMAAS